MTVITQSTILLKAAITAVVSRDKLDIKVQHLEDISAEVKSVNKEEFRSSYHHCHLLWCPKKQEIAMLLCLWRVYLWKHFGVVSAVLIAAVVNVLLRVNCVQRALCFRVTVD